MANCRYQRTSVLGFSFPVILAQDWGLLTCVGRNFVAPATVHHGETFVYDIVAENLGGGTAFSVAITDPLPPGVTFLGATPQVFSCSLKGCSNSTAGTKCSLANNTVTCTANTLAPWNLLHISALTVQIIVEANASVGTTITNTASVTSANPDSHSSNNQSTAKTKVIK